MDTEVYIVVAKSFEYIIQILVALLQASCRESPFDTHPIQTWVFVLSTIIYGLAFQLSNVVVAVIFGSISIASIVLLFLPSVPIIVAYHRIRAIFKDIHNACPRLDRQMIKDFISKFSVVWTWLTRSSSSKQEQENEQPQPQPRVSP